MVANFADPRVGAVSGELVIREGDSLEEASVGMYWKYEKLIRSAQSHIDSIPGATGSIYAMRRELARPLPEDTLLDDLYLPFCAYFKGFRLTWEPGAKAFDYPASLQTEFGRKVRTLAGVYQIIGMFPRLLIPNHRLWIHFVSHKLARLLLPYMLIVVVLGGKSHAAIAAQLLGAGGTSSVLCARRTRSLMLPREISVDQAPVFARRHICRPDGSGGMCAQDSIRARR